MSLGEWSNFYPLDSIPSYDGKSIFDALDHLAANNLLLFGGALSAIFFGWLVPKALKLEELDVADGPLFALWRFLIRFVIPPVLIVVLAGVFLEL
jgi:NSS family neurotransmitter:Na+ symporter